MMKDKRAEIKGLDCTQEERKIHLTSRRLKTATVNGLKMKKKKQLQPEGQSSQF